MKDYLVQEYAINEIRLNQKQQELQILKDGIRVISQNLAIKICLISDLSHLKIKSLIALKSGIMSDVATCSILEQVAIDANKRKMQFYYLDVIVGEFGYTEQWISRQNDHFGKSFSPSVFHY